MSRKAPSPGAGTAASARQRLIGDQALRPVLERRAELAVLSARLERAGRQAVASHLAGRVRTDGRFAPMLGRLMQMALEA